MAEDARAAYDAVVAELTRAPGVTAAKMFGMPCLKVGSKAFAGLFEGAMTFKLGGAMLDAARGLRGARLFEPMAGRPMREWVEVPYEHRERWSELAEQALQYVGGSAQNP